MFLQQHGRRPLQSKPDEKSLAMWLQNQTQRYAKHQYAMANEETRAKWEKFVAEHVHFFTWFDCLTVNLLW